MRRTCERQPQHIKSFTEPPETLPCIVNRPGEVRESLVGRSSTVVLRIKLNDCRSTSGSTLERRLTEFETPWLAWSRVLSLHVRLRVRNAYGSTFPISAARPAACVVVQCV